MRKTRVVKFKVAMDAEQAKAKKFREISFNCDMSEVSQETLETLACSAQVVRWQGEIRTHWEEKVPSEVKFGVPLFSKRAPIAMMTDEKIIEKATAMSELKKIMLTIDLLNSIGQEVPQEILDRLDELEAGEVAKAVAAL